MKIKSIVCVLITVVTLLSLSSCGAPKQAANHYGEEVLTPFSTPEFRTDMEYFRAVGEGSSPNSPTAKKIASLNARTALATAVSSVVKAVTEQYVNQVNVGDKQEYAAKFEETARSIVNQELQNVITKGEKTFSKDGRYTCFIAIEMPRAELQKSIEDAIAKDDKMALEFDKFQFQKTFDAEMDKFENQ